jgi:hypothetical protein
VQLLGSSGVLLPSGLHASISDPRSLVPVRIGVADGDCLGTSPDASPVAVALAAADSQVRPIAVPLPGDLTAAAGAAADGSGAGASSQSGNADGAGQPDPKALTWAQRNVWFGTDEEMTRLAYEVRSLRQCLPWAHFKMMRFHLHDYCVAGRHPKRPWAAATTTTHPNPLAASSVEACMCFEHMP